MIVIDASVVVAALTGVGREGSVARARIAAEPLMRAPHLIDAECISAIRGLFRGGHLSRQSANEAVAGLPSLALVRFPTDALTGLVWRLCDQLSAYDAQYAALAIARGDTLLTTDVRLARGVTGICDVELLTA